MVLSLISGKNLLSKHNKKYLVFLSGTEGTEGTEKTRKQNQSGITFYKMLTNKIRATWFDTDIKIF